MLKIDRYRELLKSIGATEEAKALVENPDTLANACSVVTIMCADDPEFRAQLEKAITLAEMLLMVHGVRAKKGSCDTLIDPATH